VKSHTNLPLVEGGQLKAPFDTTHGIGQFNVEKKNEGTKKTDMNENY